MMRIEDRALPFLYQLGSQECMFVANGSDVDGCIERAPHCPVDWCAPCLAYALDADNECMDVLLPKDGQVAGADDAQ